MDLNIKTREYTTVAEVSGPLMIVEGVEGVAYGEIVDIVTPNGEARRGQVLEVREGIAVVQVFEGTSDLNTSTTKIRFTGETAHLGVSLTCSEEYLEVQENLLTADLKSFQKKN